MEQSISVKRGLLLGAAALLMALLSAYTPQRAYADGGNTSLVHACVNRSTQQVRIVGPNDACNPLGETSLHWVMTGPQGPPAPAGQPGATTCPTGMVSCGPAGCTNLAGDVRNCGTCGRVCPAAANANNVCTAGTCGISCRQGFANCNGNAADGCEANLAASVSSCGACGRVCAAGRTCTNGACVGGSAVCPAGMAYCGGLSCTNITTDVRNCGTCGRVCPTGSACVGGVCR